MNPLNSPVIGNLLNSDIPRLCRALPELVVVLSKLCVEVSALREVLQEQKEAKKDCDE